MHKYKFDWLYKNTFTWIATVIKCKLWRTGTEMMDGQLMGEFEAEAKDLEADSWSLGVEQQFLQQLDKELVKRQDVIYGAFSQGILKAARSQVVVSASQPLACNVIKCKHPVFVSKDQKMCLTFD